MPQHIETAAAKARKERRAGCLNSGPETPMHNPDYYREEAAKYRALAEAATDPAIKKEYLELAAACEEVAEKIDDSRASGESKGRDAERRLTFWRYPGLIAWPMSDTVH